MAKQSSKNPKMFIPKELELLGKIQALVVAFSDIKRAINHPTDLNRWENDSEHSFGLALAAWYLAPKIDSSLDVNKVIRYALAHDLVEVYAGDTSAWADEEELATKSEREHRALIKLRQNLPDFVDLINDIEAYESKSDPESKFIYALDKIMAKIMIIGGGGHFWKTHGITYKKHALKALEISRKVDSFPGLQEHYQKVLDYLEQHQEEFFAPEES